MTYEGLRYDVLSPEQKLEEALKRARAEGFKGVYLVTAGVYSDYHVITAFSNEGDARALAEKIGDARVEKVALDFDLATLGPYISWAAVNMNKDGSTEYLNSRTGVTDSNPLEYLESDMYAWWWSRGGVDFGRGRVRCRVGGLAVPEEKLREKVVKVANEFRIRLLAENRWPTKETKGQVR